MAIIPLEQLEQQTEQQPSQQSNIIPIDQLSQQVASQEQSTFREIPIEEQSPTSFTQNLMLSLIPSDEGRVRYLQEKFQDGTVMNDPEKGLTIDGIRVNPKGFDSGDITRNAGNILPFAGQVIGSLGGGVVGGGTTGGVGALAGMVAGGTTGATIGKGLQLAMGKMVGLDTTGQETIDALVEEAKYAAAGEALGLGLLGAGKVAKPALEKLGIKKLAKGMANIVSKSMKKLGEFGPDAVRFTTGVKDASAKMLSRYKPSELFEPKNFNPDFIEKKIQQTFLGKEGFGLDAIQLGKVNARTGLTKGQELLAKSIKEIKDGNFDDFVNTFAGQLDDTSLDTIKNTPLGELLNTNNSSSGSYVKLAEDIVESLNDRRDVLGKEISKQASKFKGKFFLGNVAKEADAIIGSNEFTSQLRVKGYALKDAPKVPGLSKLLELRNLFYGTLKKDILDPFGNVAYSPKAGGERRAFDFLNKANAKRLNSFVDNTVESIVTNKNITPSIRNAATQIRRSFKNQFYNELGLGDQAAAFRGFASLTDDLILEGKNAVSKVASDLASSTQSGAINKTRIFNAINGLKTETSDKLLKRYNMIDTVQGLKRIDPNKAVKKFISENVNDRFISDAQNTASERTLRVINDVFKGSSNTNLSSRAFVNDIEKSVAARDFLSNNINLLRLNTMASMTGLGFVTGGPAGSAIGLAAAASLTPKNVAKLLVNLEKQGAKGAAKRAAIKTSLSKVSERVGQGKVKDVNKATLRALLSRTQDRKNK